MFEMTTIVLTIIALSALFIYPFYGIMLLFIVRPLVDTMYSYELIYGLHLTEIVSVLVPCIIAMRIVLDSDKILALKDMPLKYIWFIYAIYICFSSLIILYCQDLSSAANIFFRHINGFIGFYMVQAYFTDKKIRYFFLSLVLAGVFPMTIGIYEFATNQHWKNTYSEGLLRNIGLYHDAITVRYYALQTILGIILYFSIYIRSYFVHVIAFMYACASSIVMYKTYSKAGIIVLSTWLLVWAVFKRNILLLTLLICLGITAVCVENGVLTNITRIFQKEIGAVTGTGKSERIFEGRVYIWRDMVNEWTEKSTLQKTFGSGKKAVESHNDYLMMLFHGGIVGLVVYLVLLIFIGIRILSNLRERVGPLNIGVLMAYLMWMTDSIGLVPSAYSGYQWFVWGIIGLGLRVHQNEKLGKVEKFNDVHFSAALDSPVG
ncbi:hypothetical protein [Geobacter argillaceus]|uniref:O-antigen ligase n=1 Tax=Geobacter argillaceus TaxID=345631 RepID=A0A562VFM8_9BACT|nr:hypothetical protein [Geobacter argillaceus]TWJ16710.1 O-antigen ligase [Geobacter argillaceus]